MKCHFAIDIDAPGGLGGIEKKLAGCELPLYAWKSGHNGKIILRASDGGTLDWNMDSSDEDAMFISGDIAEPVEIAERKLRTLSRCLSAAGFAHRILLDDAEGTLHSRIEHAWPEGA